MAGPKIFLSAGEASGEHYGALLMSAIQRLAPSAEFFGLGGLRMERLGLRRVVKTEDVAVMGITEVIGHMPHIYAQYRKLTASLEREKPEIAILIDFPDVNLRLAKRLHFLGVPVVYFVSPQLWAWKKWRIRAVQRYVARMLVIFPFEEQFYREHGVQAEFVGHPLADFPLPEETREQFAHRNHLDASKTWIALLPGSRTKELAANLPGMLEAASRLGTGIEYVLPVAPTLDRSLVEVMVKQSTRAQDAAAGSSLKVQLVDDPRAALLHSRAAIVASGTATVEAALIGNPFVVVYRISPLSYAVARRVIHLPHVAMVNLVAGRRIVPEFIQAGFTGDAVARSIEPLIEEGPRRATMQTDLQAVGALLRARGSGDCGTAVERAAAIALRLISFEGNFEQGPPLLQPLEE